MKWNRLLFIIATMLCFSVFAKGGHHHSKVLICHYPPGNPDNAHEIEVNHNAVEAHLEHGDSEGECEEDVGPPVVYDAGEPEVDSGPEVDAGPPYTPDAGSPEVDSGIVDAGEPAVDSGPVVDAGVPECILAEDCTDNLFCTGEELCLGGECWPGELPCQHGVICDEALEQCLEITPECKSSFECDNGIFCDGRETCFSGSCYAGWWPCPLGYACFESHDNCIEWPPVEEDAGITEPEPGIEDAGVRDDDPEEEELSLSGTSIFSCNATTGGGIGIFALLALLLFFSRRRKPWLVLPFMMLFAIPSFAESTDHFQVAPGPNNIIVTNEANTLDHLETSGWVVGDYAYNPLVLRNSNGQIVRSLVAHQFQLQLAASLGLFDWVELGVIAPSYYYSGAGIPGPLNSLAVNSLAIGDPKFTGKVRLTPWREGLVAALRVETGLPLAQFNGLSGVRAIAGDGLPTLRPSLVVGFSHDLFKISGELGHIFRAPKMIGPMTIGSGMTYSLGGEVNLIPDVWSLVGDVYGTMNYPSPVFSDLFSDRFAFPLEGAVGTKVRLGPVAFMAGVGTGILADYGTSSGRVFVGVGWEPQAVEPHECEVCEKPAILLVPVPPKVEPEPEPEPGPRVILKEDRIEILDPIHFEFDSDVIRPDSFIILDNVAIVMKAHPEVKEVSVEGHTDFVGGVMYNQDLSERRAQAVLRYLADVAEIDEERLTARGFGELKPVFENDSIEHRGLNRRVEFIIVKRIYEEPRDK